GELLAQDRADARLELVILLDTTLLGAELPLVAKECRLVDVAGDLVERDALRDPGPDERRREHPRVDRHVGARRHLHRRRGRVAFTLARRQRASAGLTTERGIEVTGALARHQRVHRAVT